MSVIIDRYQEANYNDDWALRNIVGAETALGQSFTGTGKVLSKVTFYISKANAPTDFAYAKIYAHSGTFGTSSVPTGSPLAISNAIKSSSIGTSLALVDFTFTGSDKITLANGTKYVVVIESTGGDLTNYIRLSFDSSSPIHAGNLCYYEVGTGWVAWNGGDLIFYVWGDAEADDVQDLVEPTKLTTTKELNGPWYAQMEIPYNQYLKAESYVMIEAEPYIVKKCKAINNKGKIYNHVELDHFMSELSNFTIDRFKYQDTVSNILGELLDDVDGWSSGTVDITATVTIESDTRISVLEAIYMLVNACGGELNYSYTHSTGARTVDILSELGTRTKLPLRVDVNCDYIERDEDSTNLITRIYPVGPDNTPINSTQLDDMDDETLYTPSGAGTSTASTEKKQGEQAIQFFSTTDTETFIRDLGAGNTIDMSDVISIKFWVYAPDGVVPSGTWTFGIGEAAYDEQTYEFPPVANQGEGNWRQMEFNISAVNPANRNAIRYIGFKHNGADDDYVVIDDIRYTTGNPYIDSPYIDNYKIRKEAAYQHTGDLNLIEGELQIQPSDDTYAYEKYPTQNNGTKVNMYIRNYSATSVDAIGFLKFPLTGVPSGATVTAATLFTYCESVASGGVTGELYECDADWSELTLNNDNKPAVNGAKIDDIDLTSTGWKETDITTEFNGWLAGGNNYGLRIFPSVDQNKNAVITTKEGSNAPYIKVEYSNADEVNSVLITEATAYMYEWHIPILSYRVKFADLSRAITATWKNWTISLGDTLRAYDGTLNINTDVRIKRLVKDVLNPANTQLELTNRIKTVADSIADMDKKLRWIMPFSNNARIINANAIQKGYLGSEVG